MHVKIKSTQFERNGDCESTDAIEECYRVCYELARPENTGCIGSEMTYEASNTSECLEDRQMKWLTNELVE